MKKKETTMEDIAKELNISKVSVYKALNDKQDISHELKQKVFDCAVRLNYKYIDPLTKICRHFFYIMPKRFMSSTEQFYFGIFKELSKIMGEIGVTIEHYVFDENFSVSKFDSHFRLYSKQSNYGVFWAGIIDKDTIESFIKLNIPIVCIDNYLQELNSSFIYIDDYHSGYKITDYLIKNGHRDICFVIETSIPTNMDKFFGFRKALLENNITFTPQMHVNLSLANMQNFQNFTLPSKMPTAFLFDSDTSARNFMITMINRGYKIPQDLSIASIDNTSLCEETYPRLTSIGVLPEEIASASYKVMLKQLSTLKLKPYMLILNATLTVRDSVRSIK